MLVLLSPSKTQDFETPSLVSVSAEPVLLAESLTLIKALRKISAKEIAKLMQISEKLATLNYERYRAFRAPFTAKNAKPAIFAFKGDVYEGFAAESLDKPSLDFAQNHIRILSGLYGVLKPLDLIQPYRLEMKIRLENPRGDDLYSFWGDRITELLASELEKEDSPAVVNLASEEYFKAVHAKSLKARLVTPQFKEKKRDGYKMIALFAKKARGLMARYIAEHKITHPEALQFFAEDGYRLNVPLSTPDAPVYTRDGKQLKNNIKIVKK